MNSIYKFLKIYNDVRAVKNGRIAKRIGWRISGKITGRIFGRWFR
jgi:hypothetical protein